jgi:AhpD family alkylhydroperoxidase
MSLTQHTGMEWADFEKTAPGVLAALLALGKAVDDSGLEKPLTELIKVYASQLNSCAFCLQLHLNTARKLGIAPAKLDLVVVWREVSVFSARERAALAWTEALTLMAQQPVAASLHAELQTQFSGTEIVFLTAAVGAINSWNRIAGALRFPPPFPAITATTPIPELPGRSK